MSKVYLIGDLHQSFKPIRDFSVLLKEQNQPLTENDIFICLGDFGANFFFDYRDENFKKDITRYNSLFFVIRGNHEERPSNLMQKNPQDWHIETFLGNDVYVENKFPTIKYAMDYPSEYAIPTATGKDLKVLVLPGAYSVDKDFRIANNWTWFKDEQATQAEMDAGTALARKHDWDLILSHTSPISFQPTELFIKALDQSTVDSSMERWLGHIEYITQYKLWAFGHYHANWIYPTNEENKDMVMLDRGCIIDLYKYFCGHYKIEKCYTLLNEDFNIKIMR